MDCPLIIYPSGELGTVQYYAPCECTKLCEYTSCHYLKCGFLIQVNAIGATAANTVNLLAKACGGSMPLVAESTGDLITNANLTAGTVYRVYPARVGGILRGVVQGL